MARDRSDDDDREPPRKQAGGLSTTTIVLLVLGVMAGLVVAGCVGLFFMARNAVNDIQQKMVVLEEEMKAEAEAKRAEDPDRLPPAEDGSPVPDPLTQPPVSTFDTPESAARWTVLFRGNDRDLWNTSTSADGQFALPLRAAPKGMQFLRLRRMDSGEFLVIALQRKQLSEKVAVPGGYWNGGGDVFRVVGNEPYCVGIGHGTTGPISIGRIAKSYRPGSGFGCEANDPENEQFTAWNGQQIDSSIKLEFAVTAQELSAEERKKLLLP
jgi:hypothetical protein